MVDVSVVGADQPSRQGPPGLGGHVEQEVGHRVGEAVVVIQHEPVLGRVQQVAVQVRLQGVRVFVPAHCDRRNAGVVRAAPRLLPCAELLLHPEARVRRFVERVAVPFGVDAVARAEPDQPLPPRPGGDVGAEFPDRPERQRAEPVARRRRTHHALDPLVRSDRIRRSGRIADLLVGVVLRPSGHGETERHRHVGARNELQQAAHRGVDAGKVAGNAFATEDVVRGEIEVDDPEARPRQPDDRAFVPRVADPADVHQRVHERSVELDERTVPAVHDARDGIRLPLQPRRPLRGRLSSGHPDDLWRERIRRVRRVAPCGRSERDDRGPEHAKAHPRESGSSVWEGTACRCGRFLHGSSHSFPCCPSLADGARVWQDRRNPATP